MAIRTVATVLREGHPVDVGNLRIHTGAGTTIMHLNDGVQDNLRNAQYCEIEMATDIEVAKYPRNIQLPDQAIDTKIELKARQARFPRTDAGIGEFGLFARKETDAGVRGGDSLMLTPMRIGPNMSRRRGPCCAPAPEFKLIEVQGVHEL